MPLPQHYDETVLADSFVDFFQSKSDKIKHDIEVATDIEAIGPTILEPSINIYIAYI